VYYSGNITHLLEMNTAIIGERESGKTTILKKLIKYCNENDYTILLFDSATNHAKKSILINTRLKYKNNLVVSSPSKEEISFEIVSINLFPYFIVKKTNYDIYSFDVSKYLKKANDTENLEEKNSLRLYYKQLVFQELIVMLFALSSKKLIVIMDEIDFIPDMQSIILRCNILNVRVIAAMNSLQSLSTSKYLFRILSLD